MSAVRVADIADVGFGRDQNRAAAQLLKKQTFLEEDVVEGLRCCDVAEIDIDGAWLRERLSIENDVELQLFCQTANEGLRSPL